MQLLQGIFHFKKVLALNFCIETNENKASLKGQYCTPANGSLTGKVRGYDLKFNAMHSLSEHEAPLKGKEGLPTILRKIRDIRDILLKCRRMEASVYGSQSEVVAVHFTTPSLMEIGATKLSASNVYSCSSSDKAYHELSEHPYLIRKNSTNELKRVHLKAFSSKSAHLENSGGGEDYPQGYEHIALLQQQGVSTDVVEEGTIEIRRCIASYSRSQQSKIKKTIRDVNKEIFMLASAEDVGNLLWHALSSASKRKRASDHLADLKVQEVDENDEELDTKEWRENMTLNPEYSSCIAKVSRRRLQYSESEINEVLELIYKGLDACSPDAGKEEAAFDFVVDMVIRALIREK